MAFPAEVDSLLLRRFLDQHLACVTVSAVEGVNVSGGWWERPLAQEQLRHKQCLPPYPSPLDGTRTGGKASNQEEMYDILPLQLKSYPIFVACILEAFEFQR